MMQALQRTQQRHAKSKQEHRPPKTKRTQANKNTARKRMHTREQTKHQHTCFSAASRRAHSETTTCAVGLRQRMKGRQRVARKQEHHRTQHNKTHAHTREQTKHQHTCFSARTLRWDRKRAVGLRKRTKAQQKVSEHETLGRHEQKHETPGEQKHETLGRTSTRTRTRTRTRTSVFAKFHRRAHIRRPKAIRTDVDNHGGRIDRF